jgi:hypothetical protein
MKRILCSLLVATLPFGCKSASNLHPTPIVHQIVEAEAELFISGVFGRRPTVTPLFLKNRLTVMRHIVFARGPNWTPIHSGPCVRRSVTVFFSIASTFSITRKGDFIDCAERNSFAYLGEWTNRVGQAATAARPGSSTRECRDRDQPWRGHSRSA